jgi:hypothetical protein
VRFCEREDLLVPHDIDRRDKANALSRDGANKALLFSGIADCLSCGIYPAGQGRLRNYSTTPYRRDEVVLADHAITIFNEVDQNIENLRLYGDELVAPAQLPPFYVEQAVCEAYLQ